MAVGYTVFGRMCYSRLNKKLWPDYILHYLFVSDLTYRKRLPLVLFLLWQHFHKNVFVEVIWWEGGVHCEDMGLWAEFSCEEGSANMVLSIAHKNIVCMYFCK